MVDKLRAKFKSTGQLHKDTDKFKDDIFKDNCDELPDKIEIELTAREQLHGFGIIDIELYIEDEDTGIQYRLGDNNSEFIRFDSDEEIIKDIVTFNFNNLENDTYTELVNAFKAGTIFKVMVRVTSELTGMFKDNFHDFGQFVGLHCKVTEICDKSKVELLNYSFEDDWLYDLAEVARVRFTPIGVVEVISGSGHINRKE